MITGWTRKIKPSSRVQKSKEDEIWFGPKDMPVKLAAGTYKDVDGSRERIIKLEDIRQLWKKKGCYGSSQVNEIYPEPNPSEYRDIQKLRHIAMGSTSHCNLTSMKHTQVEGTRHIASKLAESSSWRTGRRIVVTSQKYNNLDGRESHVFKD